MIRKKITLVFKKTSTLGVCGPPLTSFESTFSPWKTPQLPCESNFTRSHIFHFASKLHFSLTYFFFMAFFFIDFFMAFLAGLAAGAAFAAFFIAFFIAFAMVG